MILCVCVWIFWKIVCFFIHKEIYWHTHKIIPFTISLMEEKCIKGKGWGNKTHRSLG